MDNNMQFRTCPNCGKQVNVTHPSCWSCGMTFYNQPVQQPQQMYYQQPQYNYNQQMQYQYTPQFYQQPQINPNLIGNIISLVGLCLCLVAVFLPYISVNVLGYSQAPNMFEMTSSDAYIILGICVINAIVLICRCKKFGIDTLVSGAILLFFAIFHANNVSSKIDELGEYSGFAKTGSGLYLLVIGALLVLIGGIVLCVMRVKNKKG